MAICIQYTHTPYSFKCVDTKAIAGGTSQTIEYVERMSTSPKMAIHSHVFFGCNYLVRSPLFKVYFNAMFVIVSLSLITVCSLRHLVDLPIALYMK